jgi:hypothetical protein
LEAEQVQRQDQEMQLMEVLEEVKVETLLVQQELLEHLDKEMAEELLFEVATDLQVAEAELGLRAQMQQTRLVILV